MSNNSRSKSTPTIFGQELQTALLANIRYQYRQKSTLNEDLQINAGVYPSVNPTMGYYVIGNRGNDIQVGINGIKLNKEIPHLPVHGGLYGILPFVVRPLTEDLTQQERAKYALRKIITVGSIQYIAYYLKRLDKSSASISTKIITTAPDGSVSESTYATSDSTLRPTPVAVSQNEAQILAAQYADTTLPLPFVLTAAEVAEILNASRILYGDEAYADISEIGICAGVDKEVALADSSTMVEAIGVQIISFTYIQYPLIHLRAGIQSTLDVGNGEPMLLLDM